MRFEIKEETQDDDEDLFALNISVQHLHADALPHVFKQPDKETMLPALRRFLEDPDATILIAHAGGIPAGYVYLMTIRRPETPWTFATAAVLIEHLAVAEPFRRMGCAHLLMQEACRVAIEQGITQLVLSVHAFNEGARQFFVKEGFHVDLERMRLSLDPIDAERE